jgi:hypothetical protein
MKFLPNENLMGALKSQRKYIGLILLFSWQTCFTQNTNSKPTNDSYSDWRLSVLANLDFGLNFARVEKDQNSAWFQRPGTLLGINPGMGLRYKEKLHFNLGIGVILDNYHLYSNYASYSVSHIYFQARGNINYMFPFKSDKTKAIVLGSDFGRSFFGSSYLFRAEQNHVSRSYSYGPFSNFIAPEIGFGRTWSYGQMSLVLTYHNIFRDSPTFMVRIEENNGASFIGRSGGNYLGFKLRANFDVKGHKAPVQRYEALPQPQAEEMLARETRQRAVYESPRKVIRILVWDDGQIDGDTISISVNGQFVLAEHGLTKRKKRVKVVLESGDNELVFHAHNEGDIPPNTAAMSIKSGLFTKYKIVLSTSMRRNESLVVRY